MLRVHEKTVSVRRPAVLKRPCAHLPSKDCTCNSLGSVPPFCTSPAKPRLARSASKTMVHHATLPIRFAHSIVTIGRASPTEANATQCNAYHEKTVSVRGPLGSQRPCVHRPSKECTCNSLGSVLLFLYLASQAQSSGGDAILMLREHEEPSNPPCRAAQARPPARADEERDAVPPRRLPHPGSVDEPAAARPRHRPPDRRPPAGASVMPAAPLRRIV